MIKASDLPPKERIKLYEKVMALRKKGYGYRKISRILGVSEGTIKTWIYEGCKPQYKVDIDKLIELHRKGLSDKKIAKELGVALKTVQWWRKKLGLKPNHEYKLPKEWNPKPSRELSYVLGVLLGDGCVVYNYIKLSSVDLEFVEAFRKALKKLGINSDLHQYKPKCKRCKPVWTTRGFCKAFVEWYKTLNLEDIREIVKDYKVDFIRGFYDSEGHLEVARRYGELKLFIYMSNTNLDLLTMIGEFLLDLNIPSTLTLADKMERYQEKGYKPCYRLLITSYQDVKAFLKVIGSNIYRKSLAYFNEQISKLCNGEVKTKNRYTPEQYELVIELRKRGYSTYKIAEMTGIPASTVKSWCCRGVKPHLFREGYKIIKKFGKPSLYGFELQRSHARD